METRRFMQHCKKHSETHRVGNETRVSLIIAQALLVFAMSTGIQEPKVSVEAVQRRTNLRRLTLKR
jgi:hypothetical protein